MNTLTNVLVAAVWVSLLTAAMIGVVSMLFKMVAKEEKEIVDAMSDDNEKTNS